MARSSKSSSLCKKATAETKPKSNKALAPSGKHDSLKQKKVVRELNKNDILFGRGNTVAKLPGNENFRIIIWAHKREYNRADNRNKTWIAGNILDKIAQLDPPGHVYEAAKGGGYSLVPRARAVEKACQALRERKNTEPAGYKEYLKEMNWKGSTDVVDDNDADAPEEKNENFNKNGSLSSCMKIGRDSTAKASIRKSSKNTFSSFKKKSVSSLMRAKTNSWPPKVRPVLQSKKNLPRRNEKRQLAKKASAANNKAQKASVVVSTPLSARVKLVDVVSPVGLQKRVAAKNKVTQLTHSTSDDGRRESLPYGEAILCFDAEEKDKPTEVKIDRRDKNTDCVQEPTRQQRSSDNTLWNDPQGSIDAAGDQKSIQVTPKKKQDLAENQSGSLAKLSDPDGIYSSYEGNAKANLHSEDGSIEDFPLKIDYFQASSILADENGILTGEIPRLGSPLECQHGDDVGRLDEMFASIPPAMTAFTSGIFSGSLCAGDIDHHYTPNHMVGEKNTLCEPLISMVPQLTLPHTRSPPSKISREDLSPNTVALDLFGAEQPPKLFATHSLSGTVIEPPALYASHSLSMDFQVDQHQDRQLLLPISIPDTTNR